MSIEVVALDDEDRSSSAEDDDDSSVSPPVSPELSDVEAPELKEPVDPDAVDDDEPDEDRAVDCPVDELEEDDTDVVDDEPTDAVDEDEDCKVDVAQVAPLHPAPHTHLPFLLNAPFRQVTRTHVGVVYSVDELNIGLTKKLGLQLQVRIPSLGSQLYECPWQIL